MAEPLLLEVGCEELPSGYLLPALEQLRQGLAALLARLRLCKGEPEVKSTGTPRRLVAYCDAVAERQEDVYEEVRGPSTKVGLKDGAPTKAAEGFARSLGVPVGELYTKQTGKGEYLFGKRLVKGLPATEALAAELPGLIFSLSFPKTMRWGDAAADTGAPLRFARPVRWIVALLGSEVIPVRTALLEAGRMTRGRRPLDERVKLERADLSGYVEAMRSVGVMVDFEERRASIASQVEGVLAEHGGCGFDKALAEEVACSTEWPTAVVGRFSERYLSLPEPVLVECMRVHLRAFPVRDSEGRLLPLFIRFRDGSGPGEDGIREGYHLVLDARLADAVFFHDVDRKERLEEKVPRLAGVLFQEKLGTYLDKTERIAALARLIGGEVGGATLAELAGRAAYLAKADLVTEMVGEFPALQGVVGGEYAAEDGEPEEVATAIAEHYLPTSGVDDAPLPATPAGRVVSLADKIDSVAGYFGVGLEPTGSADPYGVRRLTYGVVRILAESGWRLSLRGLLREAAGMLEGRLERSAAETVDAALGFLRERVRNLLLSEGVEHDLADAALAAGCDDVVDALARARTLAAMKRESLRELLRAALVAERARNILKGADEVPDSVDPSVFTEEEERRLWGLIEERGPEVLRAAEEGRYADAVRLYGEVFAEPVHTFFERVLVNVDDGALRRNRLALNKALWDVLAGRVADLSLLVVTDELRAKAGLV